MMKVSIKISRRAARIESNTAGKYSPPLISSSTWLPSFHWNVTGISLLLRERDRKDATMACDRVPWASESRRYAHRCGRAAVAASGLGTFWLGARVVAQTLLRAHIRPGWYRPAGASH